MKLKWQFGENPEKLEKEVEKIVGNASVEELIANLPYEIPYDDTQDGKLVVRKLGERVYQVSYEVYREPKERIFETMSLISIVQPSLRLSLFEMAQEVKKYRTPKAKKKTEEEENS